VNLHESLRQIHIALGQVFGFEVHRVFEALCDQSCCIGGLFVGECDLAGGDFAPLGVSRAHGEGQHAEQAK
jgi:hypothetical protein